ncbi:MAG TPA: acetate kinase [Microlunatus sp.]|jgi:acetate kinase|nr:acetate kinase [Microlunatus sp.]
MTGGPVLVINSGSSSLKYQLVTPDSADVLASGLIEQIGEPSGRITHTTGSHSETEESPVVDHGAALAALREQFDRHGPDLDEVGIAAVGHRVVHGGPDFSDPVIIDDAVLTEIEALSPLAPLHNPAAVAGIRAARARFAVPHVAVFDTAFFAGLPEAAKTYAIDRELAAEHKIRKYGFHGTSHEYVSHQAATELGVPVEDLNMVIFHLGNGASASAVQGGRAIETSMGLTPLQGLVMGTRSGDIDPSIYMFLHDVARLSVTEVDTVLNKQSGVKGLCGDNDFRVIEQRIDRGDPGARAALAVYVHRLRHYLGAYAFALGRLDLVVFTAGVGENSSLVRAEATRGLAHFGLELDEDRNASRSKDSRIISTDASPVTVMVVPTNEELAIARKAQNLVG